MLSSTFLDITKWKISHNSLNMIIHDDEIKGFQISTLMFPFINNHILRGINGHSENNVTRNDSCQKTILIGSDVVKNIANTTSFFQARVP